VIPAAAILGEARLSLKPPPRLRLSEWADEHYYLSAESAAEPGRWRTLPYQREWMDAFTDVRIDQITVMKSARVGYTKILNAAIGYHIEHDPCAILLVQPTDDDAKGYSKEEIEPMLRDCPVVGAKLIPPKNGMEALLHKRFRGGGLLHLAGARSPGSFRRVSRRVVLGDEIDGYPPSAGKEGDPIELAKRRAEHFWNRKFVWGSTPTIAGASQIERLFLAGDQRRYYVPCPHCGFMQVLRFKHFSWPKGKPEEAVYVCVECGAAIEHAQKRAMLAAGEWRPGPHAQFPDVPAPEPFHGHASFHIWAAYSVSPNATWGQLCAEFVAANRAGAEHLKTFVNTGLGETWTERGEAPDWERLYARRDLYALGTCPAGVLFLTAGVDVQKDRLVYEVVGWGREKRSWSVDIGVLPGDTADLKKGPWAQLEALLNRTFTHEDGAELRIAMLAVDSGFNTQTVYNWARRHPINRVIAVKGHDAATVLIGSPSPVDVTVSGRKLKRGYKVWPIATNVAKSELYGWLGLETPTDEALVEGETFAPGYCCFPEHGEDFFKQLTAEQLVPHKSPRGFTEFVWELIPGRENHYLDCRVYARAAAAVVGLDRFRETDFDALARAIAKPAVVDRAHPPPESSKAPVKKSQWIPQQRRGWLKGQR
jgi:terminase, large subunit